jgi:type I restriction enzyme M protein
MTVLRLSEVQDDNRVFRFDSQYFAKVALDAEKRIKQGTWDELQKVATKIESFGAYALTNFFTYVEEGIPFLRCLNIRGGFTDFSDVLHITPEAHALLAKSTVRPGMVLLTMSGSVGNAAVALDSWQYPINSNQDIAKITPKSNLDPYFLAAFLDSRYGQVQIERLPVGSVQQHIFLWMIERILVARFSLHFEKTIGVQLRAAYDRDAAAAVAVERAEQTLLRALDLEDWQPPEPLTYQRQASEAFAAGRLDAEYYAPAYDALFERLRKNGAVRLGDLMRQPIRRGISPEYIQEGDLLVINSQHVGKTHIILDDNRTTNYSLLNPADEGVRTGIVQRGDVLLNSTGRITIGRCQCLLDDVVAVVDNHIAIIRPNEEIDPVYLACFLNSRPGLMQTERGYSGSSGQIELRPDVIADYLVWHAPDETQRAIRTSIERAHSARREARTLLEQAKRAVELAIEQSEAAALVYLDEVKG